MLAATKVKISGSEEKKKQIGTHTTYQNNGKEMYKKVCFTCKVVFFLIRLIVFFALLVTVAVSGDVTRDDSQDAF